MTSPKSPNPKPFLASIAECAIPFNKPSIQGKEMEYVMQCINMGWVSGDGPYTKKCQELLQGMLEVENVLLTTNCTHALEMCAILLGVGEGDEIICPSYTFVSTINAFVLRGATPVFIDIRSDTLNMDERLLEKVVLHALVSSARQSPVRCHSLNWDDLPTCQVGYEQHHCTQVAKPSGLPQYVTGFSCFFLGCFLVLPGFSEFRGRAVRCTRCAQTQPLQDPQPAVPIADQSSIYAWRIVVDIQTVNVTIKD